MDEKYQVWLKGKTILNLDPDIWRRDDFGNTIKYEKYGDRDSIYGWEIDHIKKISLGGSDYLSNKRPLHWKANVTR